MVSAKNKRGHMEALTSSLIVGALLGASLIWLVSMINAATSNGRKIYPASSSSELKKINPFLLEVPSGIFVPFLMMIVRREEKKRSFIASKEKRMADERHPWVGGGTRI